MKDQLSKPKFAEWLKEQTFVGDTSKEIQKLVNVTIEIPNSGRRL